MRSQKQHQQAISEQLAIAQMLSSVPRPWYNGQEQQENQSVYNPYVNTKNAPPGASMANAKQSPPGVSTDKMWQNVARTYGRAALQEVPVAMLEVNSEQARANVKPVLADKMMLNVDCAFFEDPIQQNEVISVCSSPASTSDFVELPPVISVKKSSKGCAVVLLRDPAIIERCVLQRVAIVDGVCIEMTRHAKTKRKEQENGDEAPQAGIFCAWGIRVERGMPVSAVGIEEYFNSLAGKSCPEGLVARPPFQEGHLSFRLASDSFASLSFDIRSIAAEQDGVLSGAHCQEGLVKELQAAKKRLDDLWDRPPPPMARSLMTRVARSQLFPHSGEGGQEHENRAGDKLAELMAVTNLLDGVPAGSAFLDLCGGPGAWSQDLLSRRELALQGFGFTLKAGAVGADDDWQADAKDEWYEDLYEHPDWTALWGADGTGDLLKPGNLEHCAKQLAQEKVLLCVADGGFSDKAIPANLLELYFYRLLLAELLMAASCLKPGGKFVCKLYTAFSSSTAALLFLTTRMFDCVEIVKPMSSRTTGPERYLVAKGFCENAETASIRSALARSHTLGNGASPLVTPLLTPVVTPEALAQDQAFVKSMTTMATTMCKRQTEALNAVVDRADFLEDMAMESAVCSDPFSTLAQERREEERNIKEDRENYKASMRSLPNPSRGGERRNGEGKGKGKAKGKSKGYQSEEKGKGKGNGQNWKRFQ